MEPDASTPYPLALALSAVESADWTPSALWMMTSFFCASPERPGLVLLMQATPGPATSQLGGDLNRDTELPQPPIPAEGEGEYVLPRTQLPLPPWSPRVGMGLSVIEPSC